MSWNRCVRDFARPRAVFVSVGGIVLVAVVIIIGVGLARLCENPFTRIQPTWHVTAEPLPLEKARRETTVPLPDSAENIHHAIYTEWLVFVEMLRFEAPLKDCRGTAAKIIESYNASHPHDHVSGLRPLDAPDATPPVPIDRVYPSPVTWFAPSSIRKGLVAGNVGSYKPMIWIDSENSIFYYQMSD
jgi:hypothetical protein